jgi:hypothetical protein
MGAERRQHERVAILAQVQLSRESEVLVVSATNVSQGGAFLDAPLSQHPELAPGVSFDLVLCTTEDSHMAGHGVVHARAQVVRLDEAMRGVGVEFVAIDDDNRSRLKLLIARAKQE